jgi:hypothetical protein
MKIWMVSFISNKESVNNKRIEKRNKKRLEAVLSARSSYLCQTYCIYANERKERTIHLLQVIFTNRARTYISTCIVFGVQRKKRIQSVCCQQLIDSWNIKVRSIFSSSSFIS